MGIGDNKCKFYNLDFYPLIIYIIISPTRNYELTRNKINQVEKKCFPHISFLKIKIRLECLMSWNPDFGALMPRTSNIDAIETVIVPRARDIGGFEVRRALPTKKKQMVGPFIFFDQIGPAEFLTNKGIDVRPHPHIGLATLTYLLNGAIDHRDSLGNYQTIRAGDVNWMVAGNGITHSERTGTKERSSNHSLFGIQSWLALPEKYEDINAFFSHHPKSALPLIEDRGVSACLVAGSSWGGSSPLEQFSDMFYIDVNLDAFASVPLPDEHEDRAVHVMQGEIQVAGQSFESGKMLQYKNNFLIRHIFHKNNFRRFFGVFSFPFVSLYWKHKKRLNRFFKKLKKKLW
mgnify:CR=1 FL=1